MKEEFLHYIWQHQYFDKTDLLTVEGEPLLVLKVGYYNTDAGPDFKEALLKIGEVEWSGSVEIHLKASDWQRHQHQADPKYDQVVLHVVWQADVPVQRTDGSLIPALVLQDRVSPHLLQTYEKLQQQRAPIPCAGFWPSVPDITKTMMLERALVERLEQKGKEVLQNFSHQGNDWEQTAYQLLCKGFGFKTNQDAFEQLARALPLTVVRKHRQSLFQVEALLFGQAGFLTEADDAYASQLAKEYTFLRHKYSLQPDAMQRHQWNFLRMRPANFPTLRLAQLAAVLASSGPLFSRLSEAGTVKEFEALFRMPMSAYWQQHYMFGRETAATQQSIGRSSAHNLIINVAVPLLAAYAHYTQHREYLERAVGLLEQLKETSNNVTRLYEELGWKALSAADNQAALGLYKRYCQPVKCLHCGVGNKILKQNLAAL
ncbi:DUF2851 family protein [Botryobacter ruber]|uniref:DUF2851 family protein n=1 Tax=Botryobacter ruber TaxID=2171629 RepID=UPI000E0C5D94|nr:DUF2851 family protein [Botryobacter ruber]